MRGLVTSRRRKRTLYVPYMSRKIAGELTFVGKWAAWARSGVGPGNPSRVEAGPQTPHKGTCTVPRTQVSFN